MYSNFGWMSMNIGMVIIVYLFLLYKYLCEFGGGFNDWNAYNDYTANNPGKLVAALLALKSKNDMVLIGFINKIGEIKMHRLYSFEYLPLGIRALANLTYKLSLVTPFQDVF